MRKLFLFLVLTTIIGSSCLAMQTQSKLCLEYFSRKKDRESAAIMTKQLREGPRLHLFEVWTINKEPSISLKRIAKATIPYINIELLLHSIQQEIANQINYQSETDLFKKLKCQITGFIKKSMYLSMKWKIDQMQFLDEMLKVSKERAELQRQLDNNPLRALLEIIQKTYDVKKPEEFLVELLLLTNSFELLITIRETLETIKLNFTDKANTIQNLIALSDAIRGTLQGHAPLKEKFLYEQIKAISKHENKNPSPHEERLYVEKILSKPYANIFSCLDPKKSIKTKDQCYNSNCKNKWKQWCKQCKQALYCSPKCQKEDWKNIHKHFCVKKAQPKISEACHSDRCKNKWQKKPKYKCTRCKQAFYCSKECQEEQWEIHRMFCVKK